ncbi:T9SS type A sorting domain-containing protein [Segatella copri]|uniref:T9SS type A sorting domain-containing protein n=1 Tax=Segatella copri TaxID=165179 RepID=UPI00222FB8E5|nr:T9SS type A sorting domain-containing protein [Segatella copri]MCW4087398.1 T9SS type A sorting domain-containing protein [Segatella copri]MCW4160474.1 T9SS type A sorting domain-containing protein [Segatella copri]
MAKYNYIEFYFLDKSDAIVDLGNIKLGLWNQESNDAYSDFNGGGFKKTVNYFLFYKEKNQWGFDNLFRLKINTTGVNLSGYKFVVKASNTNNFETDKTTADVTYTYQLYSQRDVDAVTFTKATDPTLVKSAYALKEGNKCIFSGASVYDEIKKILEVSSKEDIKDFYIRWTIKHTDDSKVDNLTVSSGKIQKRNDFDYIYFNNTGSSIQAKDLDVTLVLPSSESWDNIKLSFVISKNVSELTTKYGVVEKEPTLDALYNITLETKYNMPFNHYVDHANTAFDEKGMQQTAEWEYYVYVKDANEQVELVLPFDKYENGIGSGSPLEPRGYFRWYDFKTDKANDNLSPVTGTGASTLLNHIVSGSNDYGLFAFNIPQDPVSKNVGVTYTAPAGASSDEWAGEDIACDISRYIDGLDATKTYLVHEPTLSIRYIFHIRSAKQLADNIMNTAIGKNTQRAGYRTYEDGKYLTVGMKDASSTLTLRLDLSDAKKYYFHPLADGIYENDGAFSGFTNRVYYVDEKDKLVESNFDKTKLCHATKIEWWAYDKTKTYCLWLGTKTDRFFDLKMNNLNTSWMSVYKSGANKTFTFTYGDPVYIVAYAMDDENHRCPIANFDVRFMNNHPMTKEEIVKEGLNNRLISYLDEHYKMATKPITFDDDDVEQTLAAPTTPDNNQDRLPSKWDRRAYSFVYRDLIDYDATNYNGLNKIGHSPLHGDYCLYKSANVNGISGNGGSLKDGYLWWQSGMLHDKTYEITNGSQYGHFLYVDASDESRKIAAADFTADLCTGQQLIFTAGVADMTKNEGTKPQIMFKLFGVKRNVNDDIVEKHLIHSFASGDFKTNVEDLKPATWYQVYGKITLQKESNVEQYSDFRLEIDNYCSNTDGADYAVDDIRMYLAPAKVQVIQEKPVCNGATTGNIKLKIRAIHETLNAILGHKDTKIYFRFVGEDGKPVTGDGFYSYTLTDKKNGTKNNVPGTEYGTVDVYDSEETCKNFEIDGTNMIEQDSEGETYIVISNKDFSLTTGKKYYVSVSTEDPVKGNANWGTPAEVCSVYSNWFEMISQHPVITDTDGKIVTDYKIPCDKTDNYEVTIKGQLTTTDPNSGGKITLDNVEFFWYINDPAVASNKLNETASNTITISKEKLPLGETHKIFMLPKGTENSDGYIPYEINGKTYLLCSAATPVQLRVMKDGPQLNFGFNDVDYPFKASDYEASLRIGLPQLKKLKNTGFLEIPLHSATMGDGNAITSPLTFVDDSGTSAITSDKVMVAYTNDPLWTTAMLNTQVATLQSTELPAIDKTTQATLNIKFSDAAVENFHEGYYYELRFAFEQRTASEGTTNCPGESYLKLKIVPEFVTWTPTADGGMNANWNNDDNWHRSSSTELYDDKYTDYLAYGSSMSGTPTSAKDIPTLNSYVPMKFTKVTIGNLNGLPFPDLGNVVYRSTNKIATKLTNGKGNEATKYIQYDIMTYWDEAAADKGLEAGNLKCEKFYGNTCHQIYFKPQGELRDQCYLIYDKAWVEKELEPNKWYTMASPLQYIYAGDMYVPAKDGRQETKAFTDITFDTNVYSRSKYPVYQRAWMKSDVKEITPDDKHNAYHYPDGAAPGDVDMNLGYWSHVYNKVDESYAADGTFGGFSIKAGNALLPKDKTTKALLRLPKADTEYQYFDYNGNENSSSKTRVAKDAGHGKFLVAYSNEEKTFAEKTQALGTDNASGFYLVANPYTCSISMAKFFEANTGLQKAIWIVENGEVKAISNEELDKKNYAIQPTQSFFVKKNTGAAIREVRFTSTMCVDRTITPGLLMASDYVKSIEATTENSNGQTSRARIALRPEASADYDDQEDVDLLYDQNLKDIPQVYTVAGNEAVAVNAVPELSWIPLGIVSQQAEEVSLTLKGVNKLDAPVYLYDAASASFTEVHDGEAVKVKAGDHGRYFLTQTRTSTGIDRMEAEEQSAPVKVYSPAAGMIVVSALGSEKLDRVQVFTLDGKMVHSYQLPDKQRMILRVPSGIYIVKASTQSCAQAKGQKISVR